MKTFILFWTYSANYGDSPIRIDAPTIEEAIAIHLYGRHQEVRFLGFEVGGDLVWDGPPPKQPAPTVEIGIH